MLAICVVVVAAALVVNAVWGLPGSGDDGIASPSPAPASAAPTPSAEPTPSPTPSPAPTPTPQPESTYQLFIEDVTWEEARDLCEEKGGHLVTISDAEELEKVTGLAETYGVSLVWIGFYRGQDGEIHWLNGEDIDYYIWGDGEPSGHDTDGAAEDYGLLWHTDGGWIYNDSRNDPVSAYPGIYSGISPISANTAADGRRAHVPPHFFGLAQRPGCDKEADACGPVYGEACRNL